MTTTMGQPIKEQWRQARTTRDFAAVEEIGNWILKRRSDDEEVRRSLARLFCEINRHIDARVHWAALRDANGTDFEAASHLSKLFCADGLSPAAAIDAAAPDVSPVFRENLHATLAENETKKGHRPFRHIAICGVSFCGSTLMDRLLGGLPGVRSIGESHWLTKARFPHGYDLADFGEISPRFIPCSYCGPKCKVLTHEFRRGLAADHTRWYQRIAAQLDTATLISADKNPPKLVVNDPLIRFDTLVLFKSPAQAWKSHWDKLPAGRDEEFYLTECQKYLSLWARTYETFLDCFRPQGRCVFLWFDDFVREPTSLFRALCCALDLAFQDHVLGETHPGHAIGGNSRAMQRLRATDYQVQITPLADPGLPPGQKSIVESHSRAQDVFMRLQAAFRTSISSSTPVMQTSPPLGAG